jgi:hypothetical protein
VVQGRLRPQLHEEAPRGLNSCLLRGLVLGARVTVSYPTHTITRGILHG